MELISKPYTKVKIFLYSFVPDCRHPKFGENAFKIPHQGYLWLEILQTFSLKF